MFADKPDALDFTSELLSDSLLAVQIKGKRGTALVRIESLAAPADTQTRSQLRWREVSLEFEKTKRGWVMSRMVKKLKRVEIA
jgi:hypothetical protein